MPQNRHGITNYPSEDLGNDNHSSINWLGRKTLVSPRGTVLHAVILRSEIGRKCNGQLLTRNQ